MFLFSHNEKTIFFDHVHAMLFGLEPSQGRVDICLVFYMQPVLVPLFQCDGEGTAVICPSGDSA